MSHTYSPQSRTAVLLTGNGTAGAYHAGVLRALHEAGVKLDLVCGCGIGVVGALFAAIDGGARTWEQGGVWRRERPVQLYRWRRPLQVARAFVLVAVAMLLVPLVVLSTAIVVYPIGFVIQMIDVDAGHRLATSYAGAVARAFGPDGLPLVIPRLVTLILMSAVLTLVVSVLSSHMGPGSSPRPRTLGVWWARLIGSPWSSQPGVRHFQEGLWQLFRGPTAVSLPSPAELSRRYVDLLAENLGQPGFRELIVTAVDLDTRSDLVFAALQEQRRLAFFHRSAVTSSARSARHQAEPARSGELIDLSGAGRTHVSDALSAALTVPVLTDPELITFSPESYWKGEAHRLGGRPGAVDRLLHEIAHAGAEQVIVVSGVAERSAPHRLDQPFDSLTSRVSEYLAAEEATAVHQAVATHQGRFKTLFLIRPAHNPVGPLDFRGAWDERSDRFHGVPELIDRGYEDAYRQFIDPVLAGD